MTDFPTDWWKEFDALGEDDVRKRLGAVVWDGTKQVAARQWLEAREAAKGAESRRETLALAKEANDLAREANDVARRNNFIAALALFGAGIAIAVSVVGLFVKSH
jgi:hypothetical protein